MSKGTRRTKPAPVVTKQVAPKRIKATNVVSPEGWTKDKVYRTESDQPNFPEILYVRDDNQRIIALYNWDTTKRHLNNFEEVK